MPPYAFTRYFETKVLHVRPYLTRELCIEAIEHAIRVERQDNNRFRFWALFPGTRDKYLQVVTLEDQLTIHNAFLDRGFKP